MKKGQMCEGIVEKVKFPNKGIVKVEDSEVTVKILFRDRRFLLSSIKNEKEKQRDVCWRFWKSQNWRMQKLTARIMVSAADVIIRHCRMKNS